MCGSLGVAVRSGLNLKTKLEVEKAVDYFPKVAEIRHRLTHNKITPLAMQLRVSKVQITS